MADVLPARMFRDEFERPRCCPAVSRTPNRHLRAHALEHLRGLHLGCPRCLHSAYVPFCFFNILSPMIDVLFGVIGFKVPEAPLPRG
jgi:NhaC family Na+:H+ antiporter